MPTKSDVNAHAIGIPCLAPENWRRAHVHLRPDNETEVYVPRPSRLLYGPLKRKNGKVFVSPPKARRVIERTVEIMYLLRRVPAPRAGDVLCFTVGIVFKGVLPAALQLIRQRNVIEDMVSTEIEARLQGNATGDGLGDGGLDYTMGAVRSAEGLTTVDVSVWSRRS